MTKLTTALALLLFTACVTTVAPPTAPSAVPPPPAPVVSQASPCVTGDTILAATLWVQDSAEYRAAALQTYAVARRMLDAALADPSWSALATQTAAGSLPPAIILDLDETSIDNTPFEARVIDQGKNFDNAIWRQWVSESAARAVPGASEFLAYAQRRGVTPFYITNRDYPEEERGTLENLRKLGFPLGSSDDPLLMRGEGPWKGSDKTARREFIASRYRVLLLLGDDLNDFTNARDKSREERQRIIDETQPLWGSKWLIVPNPIYGSWERAALAGTTGNDCEKRKSRLRR